MTTRTPKHPATLRFHRGLGREHFIGVLALLGSLVAACAGHPQQATEIQNREAAKMGTIHIDLQDGFDQDTVVIRIDGEEIYRQDDVTTKLLYGLAATTKTEVDKGRLQLEITVEPQGLSHTLPLDVQGDTFVGFSIEGGEILAIVADTPFGYG